VQQAGTRLSNDMQPVPEQQVEVAVNAPLQSNRNGFWIYSFSSVLLRSTLS
jgi:hypothetical protein